MRRRRPAGWSRASSLAAIACYVGTALQRIAYPYELQFFEGSTVEVSARVAEGLPLYGPPTTDFTPWPYPPLYFWVTGELARWTGIDLTTLRAVSFVASLVSIVLVVLIVRRVTGSIIAGLVAAGLFAGTYRVSGAWFDAARVDSLLVLLLLAAIYAGLRVAHLAGRARSRSPAPAGVPHQAERARGRGAHAGLAAACAVDPWGSPRRRSWS